MGYKTQSWQSRFWKYVKKTKTCWLWQGSGTNPGYGRFSIGGRHGKSYSVHRISWLIHFGKIPVGLCVLHHCDTPNCINPSHLFLGTRLDNNQDRDRKKRYIPSYGNTKLSLDQVNQIRKDISGLSQRELAKQFNIHQSTISNIKRRKTWFCQ